MVKGSHSDARWVLSPGLKEAPVLDRMCSQFVLTLTMRNAGALQPAPRLEQPAVADRPAPGLAGAGAARALRAFLALRCKGNEHWRGHEALARRGLHRRAMAPGAARTRKARCSSTSTSTSRTRPRTCSPCSAPPPTGWTRSLKKESTLVEKNIDALAGLLQLNPAERALLLYGTLARYQRDLRGLLVEFKVSNAQEAYAAIAARGRRQRVRRRRGAARRIAARAHRHGREPDLRAQHHRPGRPDEGQRAAAAGADARVPRPVRPDGGVHAAGGAQRARRVRLPLRRRRPAA